MPVIGVWTLVLALIASVIVSLGLLRGVQPRSTLSSVPTEEPLGLQAFSLTTPSFVAGLKAPWTAVGWASVFGLVTSRPPWQVTGPAFASKLQPGGLLAMTGIEV